jgi:hypothetical protein
MSKMQFDSMRVPYSVFANGVLWTGEQIMLYPLNEDGGYHPFGPLHGGLRNITGRKKWLSDQPLPHQSTRECTRRKNQWGV